MTSSAGDSDHRNRGFHEPDAIRSRRATELARIRYEADQRAQYGVRDQQNKKKLGAAKTPAIEARQGPKKGLKWPFSTIT